MLRYVGIILLVEFSKYLDSFSIIWSGVRYNILHIWQKQFGLPFIGSPCTYRPSCLFHGIVVNALLKNWIVLFCLVWCCRESRKLRSCSGPIQHAMLSTGIQLTVYLIKDMPINDEELRSVVYAAYAIGPIYNIIIYIIYNYTYIFNVTLGLARAFL